MQEIDDIQWDLSDDEDTKSGPLGLILLLLSPSVTPSHGNINHFDKLDQSLVTCILAYLPPVDLCRNSRGRA